MVVRDKAIEIYQWDQFPRARTALSITLALPVVAMCLLMSFSFEGPLRYGPFLLCVVAVATLIARPCNRPMFVAITAPLAMSLLGMMFVIFALSIYVTLSSFAACWHRLTSTPYSQAVWPDFPPGRLRQTAAATAIGLAIVCVWLTVLEIQSLNRT